MYQPNYIQKQTYATTNTKDYLALLHFEIFATFLSERKNLVEKKQQKLVLEPPIFVQKATKTFNIQFINF